MAMRLRSGCAILAMSLALPAQASFHFMQIEQAVGGVGGDSSVQAVQLRMRSGGQNQVQFARLRVRDATGANPIVLVDFSSPVANGMLGDRVLIASPGFVARQAPAPDFTMTSVIPVAYLAGGQITFEDDSGSVVYSLCWGNYSGPTSGSMSNDDDGQYAPCVPGPLPSTGLTALRFSGGAAALGTSNAADYALTPGAAVFTNNARASATLVLPPAAARGGDCDDTDPDVYRGRTEIASNRIDDDCDGLADEDANGNPSSDIADFDGDGETIAAGDCNDVRPEAAPGTTEIVGDRFDNDCDTLADEGVSGPSTDSEDRDGDGQAMFDRVFQNQFE